MWSKASFLSRNMAMCSSSQILPLYVLHMFHLITGVNIEKKDIGLNTLITKI